MVSSEMKPVIMQFNDRMLIVTTLTMKYVRVRQQASAGVDGEIFKSVTLGIS